LTISAIIERRLCAGSIISELLIHRLSETPRRGEWETCGGPVAGDIEAAFDTAVGLRGELYAKGLTFEIEPLSQADGA